MEFVDIEVKVPAFFFRYFLSAHGKLVEFRNKECAKQEGIFFADGALGKLGKENLAAVHDRGKVNAILLLRNHVTHELWPEEGVQTGKERSLGPSRKQREL